VCVLGLIQPFNLHYRIHTTTTTAATTAATAAAAAAARDERDGVT
jgi:hypothetical protein